MAIVKTFQFQEKSFVPKKILFLNSICEVFLKNEKKEYKSCMIEQKLNFGRIVLK
jgi:hypothetical protein